MRAQVFLDEVMMARSIVVTAILMGLAVLPARAQESLFENCRRVQLPAMVDYPEVQSLVEPELRNLCGQVVTTMAAVQPILGIAFSGGNPVLGTGSTLGTRAGIPRVSVSGRVNLALADVPDLIANEVGRLTEDEQAIQALRVSTIPIPSLQADLAVGLFDGFSAAPALGGIGAIDLLGSIAFVPTVERVGLDKAVVNIGGGARIGVLKQAAFTPGLSVSGMYRRMSEIGLGNLQQGDAAEFHTNLRTFSGRVVASKGLPFVDLAAGAGLDRYSGDVDFRWTLTCTVTECLAANDNQPLTVSGNTAGKLRTTAWNVFGNVGLGFAVVKVVGEVGYQKLTNPERFNPNTGPGNGGPLTTDEIGGNVFTSFGLRLAL